MTIPRPVVIAVAELLVVAAVIAGFLWLRGGGDPPAETQVAQLRLGRDGLTVSALATVLVSGDAEPDSVAIDWGDGSTEMSEPSGRQGSWTVNAAHDYETEGPYEVRLTVLLQNGTRLGAAQRIEVLDDRAEPPASASAPTRSGGSSGSGGSGSGGGGGDGGSNSAGSAPTATPTPTSTPTATPTPTPTPSPTPTPTATPTATPTTTPTATPAPPRPSGPNRPPTISIVRIGQVTPLTIEVVAAASDPEGEIVALAIDWGDLTIDEVAGSNQSLVGSHTYNAPGSYIVTVVVLDSFGLEATAQSTVTALP